MKKPPYLPYAYEKVQSAVGGMAASPSGLRERLASAGLAMHTVKPEDFPAGNLRDRYNDIRQRLTAAEPDGERGSVEVATSQMSDEKAGEVAHLIVDFAHALMADYLYSDER